MKKTLPNSRLCGIIAALATLFAFAQTMSANPVTLEKAKLKAQQFLAANKANSFTNSNKPSTITLDLAYEAKTADKSASCFYVLNETSSKGYIIISADDRLPDVLGYSDNGDFDFDKAPDNMKWWLSEYERQIEQLLSTNNSEVATIDNTSFRDGWSEIEPLIKTKWNQGAPYNNLCPEVDGIKTPTGCTATAVAQIMNYHKWPEHGRGSNSYEWNGQTLSMNFSQITFDWDNMQDTYSSDDNPTAQNAVATLMYACGIGAKMNYDIGGSGGSVYNATTALNIYFDYNAKYLYRLAIDVANWESLIYNELANNRPIYYAGFRPNVGHAFVCDGYSNNGLFHINWGWGGSRDGYFLLSVLDPNNEGLAGTESDYGFKDSQSIIYGISPKSYDTPDIAINETNFPDENFRNWLLEQDYGQDGVITAYEIAGVTSINVNAKSITSLKGIEYFAYLTKLYCSYNYLTSLDVSSCTALTTLSCYYNDLTSLDVSGCTALTTLDCYHNDLTSLDVSGCTALTTLHCYNNHIYGEEMDKLIESLSSNSGIVYIYNSTSRTDGNVCLKEQASAIRAKGWKPYYYAKSYEWKPYVSNELNVKINKDNFPDDNFRNWLLKRDYGLDGVITEEEFAQIQQLSIIANQIKSLEGIQYFTALKTLDCSRNLLTSLDVSSLYYLTSISCYRNQISGTNLDRFIESLPIVEAGIINIIYNSNESNVCTKSQVAAMKAKGWSPYYREGLDWFEYEGSDDLDGIIAMEMGNNSEFDANAVAYDLNGNRVEDWQNRKGIYIVNGKKVVVK